MVVEKALERSFRRCPPPEGEARLPVAQQGLRHCIPSRVGRDHPLVGGEGLFRLAELSEGVTQGDPCVVGPAVSRMVGLEPLEEGRSPQGVATRECGDPLIKPVGGALGFPKLHRRRQDRRLIGPPRSSTPVASIGDEHERVLLHGLWLLSSGRLEPYHGEVRWRGAERLSRLGGCAPREGFQLGSEEIHPPAIVLPILPKGPDLFTKGRDLRWIGCSGPAGTPQKGGR